MKKKETRTRGRQVSYVVRQKSASILGKELGSWRKKLKDIPTNFSLLLSLKSKSPLYSFHYLQTSLSSIPCLLLNYMRITPLFQHLWKAATNLISLKFQEESPFSLSIFSLSPPIFPCLFFGLRHIGRNMPTHIYTSFLHVHVFRFIWSFI